MVQNLLHFIILKFFKFFDLQARFKIQQNNLKKEFFLPLESYNFAKLHNQRQKNFFWTFSIVKKTNI